MKSLLIGMVVVFAIGNQGIAYDQASLERLRQTKTCAGCDLYKANLDNLDLTNANLQNANLKRAKFRKATLLGANLSGAVIIGTNFEGAMWVDGSICQRGSIGMCVKATE